MRNIGLEERTTEKNITVATRKDRNPAAERYLDDIDPSARCRLGFELSKIYLTTEQIARFLNKKFPDNFKTEILRQASSELRSHRSSGVNTDVDLRE